jgi:polyhydroxyalkanoate synthesis regulator phasin
MDVSQVTNPAQQLQQLLISAVDPQGSTAGSNPDVPTNSTRGVQGRHHHHHHKSMANMISDMESAIDDAVKTGKLTDDQATQMKKELDDITKALTNSQASSGTQGSSGTQPTSEDLQKIRTEFQDVRKQLFDALNSQASNLQGTTPVSNGVENLFKLIDANGNGTINENEFFTFINSLI